MLPEILRGGWGEGSKAPPQDGRAGQEFKPTDISALMMTPHTLGIQPLNSPHFEIINLLSVGLWFRLCYLPPHIVNAPHFTRTYGRITLPSSLGVEPCMRAGVPLTTSNVPGSVRSLVSHAVTVDRALSAPQLEYTRFTENMLLLYILRH